MDEQKTTPPPVPDEMPHRASGKKLDRCCNLLALIGLLAVIAFGGHAILRDKDEVPTDADSLTANALPTVDLEEETDFPPAEPMEDILSEPAPEPSSHAITDSTSLDTSSLNALDSIASRMRATADSLSRNAESQSARDSIHRRQSDSLTRRPLHPRRHPDSLSITRPTDGQHRSTH